jgi:hypothetical protein
LAPDAAEPLAAPERGRLTGALVGDDAGAKHLRVACDVRWARAAGTLRLVTPAGQAVAGRLERLIPVRRPGREGAVIEGTYAVVRLATGDVGWAEIAVIARAPDVVGAPPVSED